MSYETQVKIDNGYMTPKDVVCTCGHHRKVEYKGTIGPCPNCDCAKLIEAHVYRNGSVKEVLNIYKTIEKTDQGFHVQREEVHITMSTSDMVLHTQRGKIFGDIYFNLKSKKFDITRNDKRQTATDAAMNTFFRGVTTETILKLIATDYNKHLYRFCHDTLGAIGMERSKMWIRGIRRLRDFPMIEVLGLSLAAPKLHVFWQFLPEMSRARYVTAPHKAFGVPKFMVSYLGRINNLYKSSFGDIETLCQYFDGNSVRLIMEILDDESNVDYIPSLVENLIELHRDFGYTNLKRTMLYVAREVKLEQGITSPVEAIGLLRDYARMSQAMETRHEVYPKSLKKDHDIALANYQTKASALKQEEFIKVVEGVGYSSLDLKGKDYSIVRPTHVKDIINEGASLSHCVASYVDDIINRRCKILFLRTTDNIDNSLVTVEVRGTTVRQVRGKFNRRPDSDELAFVSRWAKEKQLVVRNY